MDIILVPLHRIGRIKTKILFLRFRRVRALQLSIIIPLGDVRLNPSCIGEGECTRTLEINPRKTLNVESIVLFGSSFKLSRCTGGGEGDRATNTKFPREILAIDKLGLE